MHKTGHNNPPHPIEDVLSSYAEFIEESDKIIGGDPVKTADQLNHVERVLGMIKEAEKAAIYEKERDVKPLYDKYKSRLATYKPTLDDLAFRKKALAKLMTDYKNMLLRQQEEDRRRLAKEAWDKEQAVKAAQERARAGDLAAKESIEELAAEFTAARADLDTAKSEKVKGMRTVNLHEIQDYKAALMWIMSNDKDSLIAFVNEYVHRNIKSHEIDGVRKWTEKQAF